jgi:nitrogen fixation protein NifU and related proteins
MTTIIKGKTIDEVKHLFEDFHELVTSDPEVNLDTSNLGKLEVFCGVREFPARVKCASLAWHTLTQAIEKSSEIISEKD